MTYSEWKENDVLHIELFDCWAWITPELIQAVERGDVAEVKRLTEAK